MPHPNHELQDPMEHKAAAELLWMLRRSPKTTMEWLRYEQARIAQSRRRELRLVSTNS